MFEDLKDNFLIFKTRYHSLSRLTTRLVITLTRLMQPGDVTVAEHTPVTIACMVSSFPEPSYEWTFNDEPMTSKLKHVDNGCVNIC